jgi:prepilin-type N-terminal cleavage/methylation domain-containing protein
VKRAAFSMIELVFVIVVLGILAAMAMPRMENDVRQEAIDNVIAAIKYTQHLALSDNVVESNKTDWQRKFWRFGKRGCGDLNGIFFYVGTDTDMEGNIDVSKGEAAIDPANGMVMMGLTNKPCEHSLDEQVYANGARASKNIFLTKNYGISEGHMKFSTSCQTTNENHGHIAFDYLGRPHAGITGSNTPDYSTLITADCNITLIFDDANIDNVIITVERETGRVYKAQ